MLGTRESVLGIDVGLAPIVAVGEVGDEILITNGVGINVAVGLIVGEGDLVDVGDRGNEVGLGDGVAVGLQLQSVDWSQSGFLHIPS